VKLLKSEKLALSNIIEMKINAPKVLGKTRLSRIIHNDELIQKGLSRRDIVIKATNELVEKGLIYKIKADEHYFVYSPIMEVIDGVHVLKEVKL